MPEAFERSRRHRKSVEVLFAHLKRILRLGRLRLRELVTAGTFGRGPVVMAITFQALFVMVGTRKRAFVTAITAKERRSGYTTIRVHDRKGGLYD